MTASPKLDYKYFVPNTMIVGPKLNNLMDMYMIKCIDLK